MEQTHEEEGPVEGNISDDKYVSWFSYLSPSPGHTSLLLVSAAVAIAIWTLGYLYAAVWNLAPCTRDIFPIDGVPSS